ncbi:MAG: hypothetical protein HY303_01620 [Candidatus Wallbacteria bacterium]|nr:hypothetical protein [Candidatus Wallbacteria bacterium]
MVVAKQWGTRRMVTAALAGWLACLTTGSARAAQEMALVRSVTAAIELVGEVPRLVLVARGVSARHGGTPVEVRYVVDPGHCGLHAQPFREDLGTTPARELRWYHVVWQDGGVERAIGSALGVRDEMPGPGPRERYELLSLPRAHYDYEPGTGQFLFEPDLARSPHCPSIVTPAELRGRTVLIGTSVPRRERGALAGAVERAGGRIARDASQRADVVLLPPAIDFVDRRDKEAEALTNRGASVLFTDQLMK